MELSSKGDVRFFGKACGIGESFLVGRLRSVRAMPRGSDAERERSFIFLTSAGAARRALEAVAQTPRSQIAALVCFGDCQRELSYALLASRVGCFAIVGREAKEGELEGKIAIVDCKRGQMIVDPSLETLKAYSLAEGGDSSARRARSAAGVCLGRGELCRLLASGGGAASGALCSAEDIFSLGEPYETALALAERFCENPLCVALDWRGGEDEERFCESAEILLCAGVYGEISLMVRGIFSPNDARRASEAMHRRFCLLEQQAREANGYLRRGFLIDTPILASSVAAIERADFICFDFDALCGGLLCTESIGTLGAAEREALCLFWRERRRALKGSTAKLCALSRGRSEVGFFYEWADYMGIDEIYLPPSERIAEQNFEADQKRLDKR